MTEGQKSLEYLSLTIKYPGPVVTSLLFTTHGWGPIQAQETGGAVLPGTHKGESDCGAQGPIQPQDPEGAVLPCTHKGESDFRTLSLNRAND